MTENPIFQIIGEIPTATTLTFIAALVAIVLWVVSILKKSDRILSNRYNRRERNKTNEELIHTTAKGLEKLEQRHATDTEMFEKKIDSIADKIDILSQNIEEQREVNNKHRQRELRAQIIEDYEYYTGDGKTMWTKRTAQSFWELVDDYEAHKGNGYVHEVVVPAMRQLKLNDE